MKCPSPGIVSFASLGIVSLGINGNIRLKNDAEPV